MISKSVFKYIRSLEQKKVRAKERTFVAEGPKVVADLMKVYSPLLIVATDEWYGANIGWNDITHYSVSFDDLRKLSFLQHPQQVLAVFEIPNLSVDINVCTRELCLALDGVQDPGNLGTIIRIADWFGFSTIFCNIGTADAYNPKVVQATMGSIARVKIVYTDLKELLMHLPEATPIYGTSLSGENIYSHRLASCGLIIMGNEGNGISSEIMSLVNHSLYIPCYNKTKEADSLNVAVATAITCAEFRRQSALFNIKP